MKLLGRARGWGFGRPIHRVKCDCGRVYVVCSFPGAIRKRQSCVECRRTRYETKEQRAAKRAAKAS